MHGQRTSSIRKFLPFCKAKVSAILVPTNQRGHFPKVALDPGG